MSSEACEEATLQRQFSVFFDSLFDAEAVSATLASLITSAQQYMRDPLQYVMLKCLTEPLSLTLVDSTCALFRSDPTVVLTYRSMLPGQLRELQALVRLARDHAAVNSIQQRGGAIGIIVRVPKHVVLYAPHDTILAGLQRLLHASALPQRDLVINVIMQRLIASSKVAPGQLARARDIVRRWSASEDRGTSAQQTQTGRREIHT